MALLHTVIMQRDMICAQARVYDVHLEVSLGYNSEPFYEDTRIEKE